MATNIIIYYFKIFAISIYGHYCYNKILNIKEKSVKNIAIVVGINLVLALCCSYIKFSIGSFWAWFLLWLANGVVLALLTEKRIAFSLVVSLIAYAICILCLVLSIVVEFALYKLININNNYVNFIIIILLQYIFLKKLLKIKKFKNGLDFLYIKLNNDFTDVIFINISIAIIFIYCIFGTILQGVDVIRRNLLISFIILGCTMLIMIQKTLTMHYKQKLLQDNLTQYKQDLSEKEQEIQKLKAEKYSISKITHEFYNRQKALELAVKTNTKNTELINRIHNLTEEYSNELTNIKLTDKLAETGIPEIDDMFRYMQQECRDNNIRFQLKIEGDIYYLINNIIPKNKLETLIGDHIRDAINAVSVESVENKEVLVIMGIKENKYEFCIYDTGVEFKKDTLLKLGLENVTTNKNKGGKGIGFITTFETLNQTGGSFIIEEFAPEKDRIYTKAVKIRFDNKKEYRIISYRANEIMEENKRMDIIIEDNLAF